MNCSSCGEVCRCHAEPPPSVELSATEDTRAEAEIPELTEVEKMEPAEDTESWRGEISDRLNRYRARRKMRPPRYPSLSLQFGPAEKTPPPSRAVPDEPHPYELVSDQALALNEMQSASVTEEARTEASHPASESRSIIPTPFPQTTAKIIEFPRFAWGPPEPPADQLAEPVGNVPRILDVPESAPPPPALGGIIIEPVQREPMDRRPGIDIPLQGASLTRRLTASLLDWIVVAAGAVVFDAIFWRVTAIRPPKIQLIALAAGIPVVLWFAYQYLFIVYGGTTPGLRLAGLRLTQFDGSDTRRRKRRSRVLASLLSAISLGMGYAWVFLDEDVLCWHDRITHTYLGPVNKPTEG